MKIMKLECLAVKHIEKLQQALLFCTDEEGVAYEIWAPETAVIHGDELLEISRVSIKINQPGDFFVAAGDSKSLDAKGQPLFKKGDKVERKTVSYEFLQAFRAK